MILRIYDYAQSRSVYDLNCMAHLFVMIYFGKDLSMFCNVVFVFNRYDA